MAKPSKQPQAALQDEGPAPAVHVLGQHAIIDMAPSGAVTGWNPVAALLYGYQAAEIVGRAADVLCLPEGRAAEADILHRVLTDGRTERYEAARVCKDGTVITVSLTVAPIVSAAGDTTGATVVSWKVSPRDGAEDQVAAVNDRDRRDVVVGERDDAVAGVGRGAKECQRPRRLAAGSRQEDQQLRIGTSIGFEQHVVRGVEAPDGGIGR